MNLVADESIDRPIVERLRQDGHVVEYVAEFGPGTSDDVVLTRANEKGAPLVTADKDFGELVFRQKRVNAGVVLVRLAGLTSDLKARIVTESVATHGAHLHDRFTVISAAGVRIRSRLS